MNLINGVQQQDDLLRDENQQMNNNQMNSDAVSLLKKKMTLTNNLINQFKNSMEKCAELQDKLTVAIREKQEMASKYSSTLEIVEKLKLKNSDQEKSIEKYKQSFTNQKIKLDENTQLINQLNFKVTEVEKENHVLKECKQILKLEKSPKIVAKEKESVKQVSQCRKTGFKNISTNTDSIDVVPHLKKIDKSIMAEFQKDPSHCKNYTVKDNPSVEQILEIMTNITCTPMPLLSPESPLKSSSFSGKEASKISTNDTHNVEVDWKKDYTVPVLSKSTEFKNNSLDQITEVTQKIKEINTILEELKNDKSKNSHIKDNSSCKEIEFRVQLPTKRQILDCKKSQLHKVIKIKRLNSKKFPKCIKKRKCLFNE